MAKDGSVQVPNGTAPIDPEEQFWNSDEGQDIQRLFNEFRTGKKSFDETYEEYNKKWANQPLPNPARQVPTAPLPKLK